MNTYYIGADGGGTRTTAVLVSSRGEILAVTRGKGLNYHTIGMESARTHLKECIDALSAADPGADYKIGVGMSALDDEATSSQLEDFAGTVFDKKTLFLHSDAYMALMAATLGKSGVIVICGTGSMAVYADKALKQTPAGGWGYLLGDAGSSYTLAVDGMRAAICSFERTGEKTLLADALIKRYHLPHPRALIDIVYAPHTLPSDIAQFAIDVLSCAEEGDCVALSIVDRHMDALSETVYKLTEERLPTPVWLYGGVFEHNPWMISLFREKLRRFSGDAEARLIPYPPAIGACIYAMARCGKLTDEVLMNIHNTYKETLFQ